MSNASRNGESREERLTRALHGLHSLLLQDIIVDYNDPVIRRRLAHEFCSWFRDYLCNRWQRVVYNGHPSGYLPVKYGVPQGSILGPVLFLCLLVDLPDVISSSSIDGASIGSSGYADECIV